MCITTTWWSYMKKRKLASWKTTTRPSLGMDDVYVIGYGEDVEDLDIVTEDDVEVVVDIDDVDLLSDLDVLVCENGTVASTDDFLEEYTPDVMEGDGFMANNDDMELNDDTPDDFIDDAPLF